MSDRANTPTDCVEGPVERVLPAIGEAVRTADSAANPAVSGPWIGYDLPRANGHKFVAGRVPYSADLVSADSLRVALVRSPHARARIVRIVTQPALRADGVVRIIDGVEAACLMSDMPQVLPFRRIDADGGGPRPIVGRCLADGVVCYAGQPVVAVVAEDQRKAEAAADLIIVEYEPLDPVLDSAAAALDDSPRVHPDWSNNVVATDSIRAGDVDAAIAAADVVIRDSLSFAPTTTAPMETLCYAANWDLLSERLTITGTFQNPHTSRWLVATSLGLREADVRIVAPAMGGSFGYKMSGHTEEALVGMLSRLVRRPVAYVEGRRDTFRAPSRTQTHNFEIAARADGRIVAFRDAFSADVGVVGPGNGWTMPLVTATLFPTGYDIENLSVDCRLVATNTPPWQPIRGYGKEIANAVMERAVDLVAKELGMDPIEIRAINLLRPDQLPHRMPSGLNLDSGDYPGALGQLRDLFGYEDWRSRQADVRAGRQLGIGIAFELTPEGGARPGAVPTGYETATVRMSPTGDVQVLIGVTSPGSGNETGIAQLVANVLCCDPHLIRVVQGDTDATPIGTGNASSRAMLYGGTAAHLAATDLRDKIAICAANMCGAMADGVRFADSMVFVDGGGGVALNEVAMAAYRNPFTIGRGIEMPLEATRSFRPSNVQVVPDENGRIATYSSFPYSLHAAVVELDTETGRVTVVDYAAVHDCGVMINPAMVTGQFKGAIAMGIGAALWEELTSTPLGALVSDRFKTYLLPRASDLPEIRVGHRSTPSPFHPLGLKGAGESGVGGAMAAVTNAVADALGEHDQLRRVPSTPPTILPMLSPLRGS